MRATYFVERFPVCVLTVSLLEDWGIRFASKAGLGPYVLAVFDAWFKEATPS